MLLLRQKKRVWPWLAAMLLGLAALQASQGRDLANAREAALAQALSDGTLIRLHIIADSDADGDQAVKLAVRDDLLAEFAPKLAEDSPEGARQTLQALLPDLEAAAARSAKRNGFDGTVAVSYERSVFPTRLYGNVRVPAGTYDALVVRLGSASGHNWWCVMYPPLCLETSAEAAPEPPVPAAPALRLGSSRLQSRLDARMRQAPRALPAPLAAAKTGVQYRSVVWDWLKGLW